jgi:hypothetical protein
MGRPQPTSFAILDPLGLLALPIASTGRDRVDDNGPPPRTDGANSSGMAIDARTLGSAPFFWLLIAVGLIALPGAEDEEHTSRSTAVWKADDGRFGFASHHPATGTIRP